MYIFEIDIDLLTPGDSVGLPNPDKNAYKIINWGKKIQEAEGFRYNVIMGNGALLYIPPGIAVISSR